MTQHEKPTHTTTTGPAASPPRLPATLRLGAVHLSVTDLDRSVAFYESSIGLRVHHREGGVVTMGVGVEDLLILYGEPSARRAGRHASLYHYALLFPSRQELARAALRLAATQTPIQGTSDHGTHEAIYLPDPDGNGIELAADRASCGPGRWNTPAVRIPWIWTACWPQSPARSHAEKPVLDSWSATSTCTLAIWSGA